MLQDKCKAVDRVEGRLKEGGLIDAFQESFCVELFFETCRARMVQEAIDKGFRKPIGYGFEPIDELLKVFETEKEVEHI